MKRLSATTCLLLSASLVAVAAAPASVRFNRDIRPILSDNCYACHGPDKNARKAKLRLDTPEGAYESRDGLAAIVPGEIAKSALLERIHSADPDEIMPPPKTGKRLSPEQKKLLHQWIAAGATYEPHWVFTRPVRSPVPQVKRSDWPLNPIDRFVLSRLEKEELQPSDDADPRTLTRRLSLDLLGLPPEPEEVERYVNNRSAAAYNSLVKKFLDSPHYGERLAIHWLDLVRYADTVGFHGDMPVSVWPYRDYVINAFNSNMPFDQFTREQLAGDLLPNATPIQKVASAYNRLNRMSTEGGIQDKEYLAKYAADRVRTTSTIWMGATMGCAECHDHKFDPYSTKDFYRFAAFFADLKEKGFYDKGFSQGDWGPRLLLPNDEQKSRLAALEKRIADLTNALNDITVQELGAGRTNWAGSVLALDEAGLLEWRTQKPLEAISAAGATLSIDETNVVTASGHNPDNDAYTVSFRPGPGEWHAFRLETLLDESFPGNRIARGGITFVVTEVELTARERDKSGSRIAVAHAFADAQGEGYPALAMIDRRADTGWALTFGHSKEHQAVFQFTKPQRTTSNTVITVKLRHDSEERRATIARFRLSLTSVPEPSIEKRTMPEDVYKALRVAPAERTADHRKAIANFHRRIAPELAVQRRELAKAEAERSLLLRDVPSTLVTEAAQKPRDIRVLPRGNWMDDSGEVVEPGVPNFLPALNHAGERATRLHLADWFVSVENPLTARAFVNRLWRIFFGTGLSATLDDLGAQGEWPSHPELLDWLACEFMDSGWDIKHMVQLIVSSRTYRQSSHPAPALERRDPLNRLLGRQSRFRLEAELVRDNALAISGLLSRTVGGRSVRPYQPAGYFAPLNFPKREYQHDRGANLYRRSLYTHWQRTFTHPMLLAFDAPSREECTANRVTSNTPLQALSLLNDPIFVEAARVFAQAIIRQGGRRFESRLDWAYKRAVARPVRSEEIALLREIFDRQLTRGRSMAESAEITGVGEAPIPPAVDPAELAAWTNVARAILNLNETITRN